MVESLADAIRTLDVENVFIYVGDAVRWDYHSKRIAERGPTYQTIAASIHSPTSFASLITGQYPPTHGVYSFTQSVAGTDRLFDVEGYQTGFVNSVMEAQDGGDPIFQVVNQEPSTTEPILKTTEPFIMMERGPGGHAPYTELGTAKEYFESRANASPATLQSEYRSAIARDVDLFERRLKQLEDQGLRDDTLVIYTSDHGELLGEGGMIGHNAPMRPELVYVPTTFVNPELSNLGASGTFRHIDLVPTVLAALDEDGLFGSLAGSPGTGTDPGFSFYDNKILERNGNAILTFGYDGVWTADGGHVFARTALISRLAVLAGKLFKSPKRGFLRRHLPGVTRSYLAGDRTYGTPSISINQAERILELARTKYTSKSSMYREVELSEEANERLKDMGYL